MSAPRKKQPSIASQSSQQENERLKKQLEITRQALITLLPKKVASTAEDFLHNYSAHDRDTALTDFVAKLIDHATLSAFPDAGCMNEVRAYCPLCGEGSQGPYEEGYRIPGGMARHLYGRHNCHQCHIMTVLVEMAKDRRREIENGGRTWFLDF